MSDLPAADGQDGLRNGPTSRGPRIEAISNAAAVVFGAPDNTFSSQAARQRTEDAILALCDQSLGEVLDEMERKAASEDAPAAESRRPADEDGLRAAAAVGWDAAVAAMKYEDGSPVDVMSTTNPYRADRDGGDTT